MVQRVAANRLNAKLSTGPRTEVGKSRSKMNALKHGLSAKKIVIGDEDPKDFDALRAAVERDWQPETALEFELIDQLAGLLRRVPAIEAAIVKAREEKAYSKAYSEVEDETWDRIDNEARERCNESLGPLQVQLAMNNFTYAERLGPFRKQVIEEEEKKGDLDASISKQADERYQEKRESELTSAHSR